MIRHEEQWLLSQKHSDSQNLSKISYPNNKKRSAVPKLDTAIKCGSPTGKPVNYLKADQDVSQPQIKTCQNLRTDPVSSKWRKTSSQKAKQESARALSLSRCQSLQHFPSPPFTLDSERSNKLSSSTTSNLTALKSYRAH